MGTIRIKTQDTDNTVFEEVTESAIAFTEDSVNQEIERIDQQIETLTEQKVKLEKKIIDAKKL